jgi:response regulator of citrate/malate metabolism
MIGVLVVDDDFMVGRVHSGYVGRVPGFKVVGVARTGQEALDMIDSLHPDLVLLDIYLPDFSGVEVLRRLRASGDPVDVLVITAARDVDTVRASVHGGVVHYLIKPFTYAALRERLERYAEARRRIEGLDEAVQDDVDGVLNLLHGGTAAAARLPKGLSAATCELVASVLREAGSDLSAAEAAERAGLSRVSTRRYLEWLASAGQVQLRMRYGTAGRPEHRYRWARPAAEPTGGEPKQAQPDQPATKPD